MITWWADGQRVTEQYPRRQISGLVQLDEQTYMRNLSYNTLWLSDTSDLYCIASVLSTYLYSDRAAVPYDLFVQSEECTHTHIHWPQAVSHFMN